jgi:hypothetical protein
VLIVTLISAIAGVTGVAFAIWTYFATRRFAEIRYEISQFVDYRIPPSFLRGLLRVPIAIRVESTGNKAAENVSLVARTKIPIVDCEVEPAASAPARSDNEVRLTVARLNPGQSIRIFLQCNGDPTLDQVASTEFTHAEGAARLFSGIRETRVLLNPWVLLALVLGLALLGNLIFDQTRRGLEARFGAVPPSVSQH